MTKRALDLVLSVVLIVLTLPVLLVAAVVSAATLRTWPFFVQQRTGLAGRPFRFVKVRTLPREMPAYVLKRDLRLDEVPRACRLLRRLHVDELPQLFLVLTGRMSLVGPRPEMVGFSDRLEPGFAAERTAVRPGCTGLWQIGPACMGLIGEAPEYDRWYARHQSTSLDLWILWRTARMMLGLGGLVALSDLPVWAAPVDGARVSVPRPELELADAVVD
jgi:lipopolysaccharide/colanic/teichoic acid biosynthesis glycosyltransferase